MTGDVVPPAAGPVAVDQRPSAGEPVERIAGAFLMAYRGHTLTAYRGDLRQWFAFTRSFSIEPLDATRPLVSAWIAHMNGAGRSAATISRKVTAVTRFYKYAVDEGHLERSPVPEDRRLLNLPRVSSESTKLGPDLEHARALVAAAGARGTRDFAVVLTLLSTGARVSELVGLTVGDVGVWEARRYLTVTRKGGKRQRLLLVPDAAAAVDRYLAERWGTSTELLPALPDGSSRADQPLFADRRGREMTRDQITYVLHCCADAVDDAQGVTVSERQALGPHRLRHAAITNLIREGATLREAQLAAGHAQSTTTERYVHDVDSLTKSPLRRLDGLYT